MEYEVKEIEKIEDNILKKFNISPLKKLAVSGMHNSPDFLTILCVSKKNPKEKFTLKIILKKYSDIKERFKREILTSKFFTEKNSNLAPQYIDSSFNIAPEWFLYKYKEGETLGSWYTLENKFLTPIVFDKILANILALQKETESIQKETSTQLDFNKSKKVNKLKSDINVMKELVSEKDIQRQFEIFNNKISDIVIKLSHNDLHPSNIISSENFTISFIDFFHININNIFFDLVLFILCGWNNKDWIKSSFQKLFQTFPELKNNSTYKTSLELALIEASVKLTINADYQKNNAKKFLAADNNKEKWISKIKETEQAKEFFREIFINLDKNIL